MAVTTGGALAAGAIAAPIIGGVMGQNAARGAANAANAQQERALALLAGLEVPDIASQQVSLEDYSYLGDLLPQLEQAQQQGDSRLSDVSIDPRLRQQQMSALEQMSGIASTGLSDADRATFEMARRAAAQEAEAKSQQILQEMQQRGQGGSGNELIARLQAAQSSADRLSTADMQAAQAQQQARLQALASQSNMATGLRSQDYGEQSDLARARDAISNFNTQNAQSVSARNVGAQNQAAAANLTNRQNIANQNVGTHNQQQQYNKGLIQQRYQNEVQKAGGQAAALNNMAGNYLQQAGNAAASMAAMGQGVGNIAMAGANALNDKKKTT